MKKIIEFFVNLFRSDCPKCGAKHSITLSHYDMTENWIEFKVYKCLVCEDEFI